MKTRALLLTITFLCALHMAARESNSALLLQLDSIIANQGPLIEQKEIRLGALRQTLAKTKPGLERMGLTRELYDEYIVFDSDSALYYASETRKMIERYTPDDYDELTRWKLNEAFIYSAQGLFDKVIMLLERIDSSQLSNEMKSNYFMSLSYIYSMQALYLRPNEQLANENLVKANEYRDSVQAIDIPGKKSLLWVPIASAIDSGSADISHLDVTELRTEVDGSTGASRHNAINAYWLARYYESVGNMELMVRYKAISAINDALILNREIASIQELATYLFEKGDLNRAYNYLVYTVEQANLYHNRFRMVSLSDVLPTVRDAYRNELEKRDSRLRIYIIVLSALALILIASIIFVAIEFSKLKKTRNLLKDANDELTMLVAQRDEAIAKLEKINDELNATNQQKISLLAYAFKLTTQYIKAIEDYRKKLLKKYMGKKIDDLGVLINDPELLKEHYQDFYESFDRTILSVYPDFVEEYNKTVDEDGRFSVAAIAKTKSLNTKLRIYALKRLGIFKSAEIAEMLNVSIRTVYNNRTANAPEK